MKSEDLGLPIEYQMYPEYFDSPIDSYHTQEKNKRVETLLRKHGAKTVFDMTCGTGAQVFYLANLGYQVVGSDFSPGLIRIAKEKALKQGIKVEFIDGDMRNVQVGQFDAVITIDNAIGHLTRDDFEIAIQNIRENLKEGGFYIFDILNLEAMTDDVIKADSEKMSDEKVTSDGTIIRTSRRSWVDRTQGYIASDEDITICREGREPEKIQHRSALRIYTMQELQDLLSRNGFKAVEQFKADAYTFEKDDSGYSILTVAQKKYHKEINEE